MEIGNSRLHNLGDYISRLLIVRDSGFERRVGREEVGDRRGQSLAEMSRQLEESVRLAAMDILHRDSRRARRTAREHRSLDLFVQIFIEHTVLILWM